MMLNILCSWRSLTAILSPEECGFNLPYFPIIDTVVMVMLTAGETVFAAKFTH